MFLSPRDPVFISFEGIDGSGKSTQARMLADVLRQRGQEVVEVREPGGTPLGEQIRQLLLDPQADILPRAELLLFSAARAQLVDQVILPALDRGAVAIADLMMFVTGGVSPDRTYLIDVDVTTAWKRRRDRKPDRMESGGEAYYRRIRAAYLEVAARHPERVVVIESTDGPAYPHAEVLRDFEQGC
jgi:dTMP kinase